MFFSMPQHCMVLSFCSLLTLQHCTAANSPSELIQSVQELKGAHGERSDSEAPTGPLLQVMSRSFHNWGCAHVDAKAVQKSRLPLMSFIGLSSSRGTLSHVDEHVRNPLARRFYSLLNQFYLQGLRGRTMSVASEGDRVSKPIVTFVIGVTIMLLFAGCALGAFHVFSKASDTHEGSDRGEDMLERRKKGQLEWEVIEEQVIKEALAKVTVLKDLHAEVLSASKWRVHGIHVDQAIKVGLRFLDSRWDVGGLIQFPRRQNGASLLLKEPLMKELLTGDRQLQSVPASDVSALQGDVKHLTLRQLLKLYTANLDFDPRNNAHATHAALLETANSLLFEQIGKQAVPDAWSFPDARASRLLGVDIVLISAVSSAIATPQWWVCWIGECRAFFHNKRFECTSAPPHGGVLEIADKSGADPNSKGLHSNLDWYVSLVENVEDLSDVRIMPSAVDAKAALVGANLNAPQISSEVLTDALKSLKHV